MERKYSKKKTIFKREALKGTQLVGRIYVGMNVGQPFADLILDIVKNKSSICTVKLDIDDIQKESVKMALELCADQIYKAINKED